MEWRTPTRHGMSHFLKQWLLICLLLAFVLLVNYSIISTDMMYPEQPTIYTAYHAIHHWQDLINIYLHPKLFHPNIPFFRPSGHFFLYRLIIPVIGWYNTKALIIVNLTFLAFTGYFIIQLYRLLFPNRNVGGYIAFSFYLMHPALILPRLIILHFEFAYVMFAVWSLYCFVRFCHENRINQADIHQLRLKHLFFLATSLLLYAIAITFKEGALPLGAALLGYFYLSLYQPQKLSSFIFASIRNREIQQVTCLIIVVSISLVLYLTLPWPHLYHPLRYNIKSSTLLKTTIQFFGILFTTKSSVISISHFRICDVISPLITRLIIWMMLIATLINSILLFRKKAATKNDINKKSCLFLFFCIALFLLIPIQWGMGQPWHLNLSLLFLGILAGFSIENLAHVINIPERWIRNTGFIFALLIGATTYPVNEANIRHIYAGKTESKILPLNYNAVFHPPNLRNQLNRNSIIVVEDTTLHDDYYIGNSSYPFVVLGQFDYDQLVYLQHFDFIQYHPIYNGTLFSWAYNIPTLREEIFPFRVEAMNVVPNEIIYEWLQVYDNIFCLGYDAQSNWHDKTTAFKTALLIEKAKRHLSIHPYQSFTHRILNGTIYSVKRLPFPDHHFCQYDCDQQSQCRGFTYAHVKVDGKNTMTCYFSNAINANSMKPCAICRTFVKNTSNKVTI